MRCPALTTDDQLEQVTLADDIIRSLAIDLPHIKCDPATKNTVQLLLNHIDLIHNHDQYAALLDARRRGEIAGLKMLVRDLLDVVETGHMNHLALAKAREALREDV